MIKFSKNSQNLIGVSVISSVLVLWLGAIFLSDAHTQLSGATQLQNSVTPEVTLFQLADSLDKERATIQRTLVSDEENHDAVAEYLDELSENTTALFEKAQEEMAESREGKSKNIEHRFSDNSLQKLTSEVEDQLKRMSFTKTFITKQIYLPHTSRDENVRMQNFDSYNSLISEVNKLRKRTHALPNKTNIDVLNTHEIKNSIWVVDDAVNQITTLIESFLLKHQNSTLVSINVESLALRLLQQHDRANQAISDLDELVQARSLTGVSRNAVDELKTDYDDSFHKRARQLILSPAQGIDPAIEIPEWNDISSNTKEKILALENAALTNTLATANDIKTTALTSLVTNTLLVLLCAAMAYATFRIARKIQHQADHDDLTGMPNRRYFNAALETNFKNVDPDKGQKLVLMTMDLNGFKSVNDTMGHVAGDHLLMEVARRLTTISGKDKTLARMGGDEFAVGFITENPSTPFQFACEIRESFDKSFSIEDGEVNIDTSIGYSVYPDDAKSVKELQITSDFAMFSAKQSGRRTIQPYDHKISSQFENRIAIEKDLVSAIEKNELELHYQPQFNFERNQVDAVEALIRWNHPTRGVVPPAEFISVAEETGLMPAIGTWILNEACRQAAEWNNDTEFPIRIAVNVSVHQVMQNGFVQSVTDTIEKHKVSMEHLELEITESVVMADIKWIVTCLNALKSHGIRIALDDFGTGYSSLNQLQELPLDALKIDQSFISGLEGDSKKMKSVTATIASIAEIFGLETVAEGIETNKQLIEVRKLGIDIAQGYYYSKPVPANATLDTISGINSLANENKKAA